MNWRSVSLGKLCTLRAGNTFKPKYQGRAAGDYPFIKVKDMNSAGNAISITEAENWVTLDECREFRGKPFPPGTSVFAKIGEALRQNRVRFIVRDTLIDNNMMGAMANPKIADERFLYYLLSNFDIASNASGTALPYLTVKVLSTVRFQVPDLSTQRRMAEILSAYDDLIENNRRRIRLLEQAARLFYREWFVHLRYPGHEHTTVIDGVPAGWERKNLRTVAEIKGGKQYQGKEFNSSGNVPVFGGNGIQGYSQKRTHNGFVIIFGRVGANCGSIHWSYDGAWINNNASSVVPNCYDELILQHLLHYDFIHLRKGAAQPFIPNNILSNVDLLIPVEILATKFCKLAGDIRHQQQSLSSQIRMLMKARDMILPDLMDGKVKL